MPITIFEFEGVSPTTEKWLRHAHAFLKAHPDLAYAEDELSEAVPGSGGAAIREALDWLIYLGAVDERLIDDKAFFAYRADLPL